MDYAKWTFVLSFLTFSVTILCLLARFFPKSREILEGEITEKLVYRGRDGHLTPQYVWPQEEGEEFLEQYGQLRVFPLISQEYSHWHRYIESEEAGLL
jgi:hypothetical protein